MNFSRVEKVDLEVLMNNLGLTEDRVLEELQIGRGTINEWKATKEVPLGVSDELRRIARGMKPSRIL